MSALGGKNLIIDLHLCYDSEHLPLVKRATLNLAPISVVGSEIGLWMTQFKHLKGLQQAA